MCFLNHCKSQDTISFNSKKFDSYMYRYLYCQRKDEFFQLFHHVEYLKQDLGQSKSLPLVFTIKI